ncbi:MULTISPECIES: hypothetical protein [unclassified Streptomyces]|nr:hypothetical protein [Streptomyces sp. CNQ-509]
MSELPTRRTLLGGALGVAAPPDRTAGFRHDGGIRRAAGAAGAGM